MGYDTYFSGEFEIKPPLTESERAQLLYAIGAYGAKEIELGREAAALKERIDRGTSSNGYHATLEGQLPFVISADGASMHDTGDAERCYYAEQVLNLVVREFLAPLGHSLKGEISWQGDDSEDRGTIYAQGGDVEWVEDVITNPGPSWACTPTDGSIPVPTPINEVR
jgi:hypothetical protein